MHKGSRNSWLSSFEIGERRYVDTALGTYAYDMRAINTPRTRRPAEIKDWVFTTNLLTAVGSAAGDVRYLICTTREA